MTSLVTSWEHIDQRSDGDRVVTIVEGVVTIVEGVVTGVVTS